MEAEKVKTSQIITETQLPTTRQDIADALSIIMNKLYVFAKKNNSEEVYKKALYDFFFKNSEEEKNIFLDTNDKEFLKILEDSFFAPWYLFNYNISQDATKYETIASQFFNVSEITTEEQFLTEFQEKVFIAFHKSYYTLLQVLSFVPGESITFEDVLLGKETTIAEVSGSHSAKIGSLFFGRIISVDDINVLATCCNFTILSETKDKMFDILNEVKSKVLATENPEQSLKAPHNDNALRNLFFGWALSQIPNQDQE